MNILIAVPCMDSVPAVFAQSLAMLQKTGNVAVAFQLSSLIYDSRNQLGKKAVEMGADLVLWLDSDMVFEPNLLVDMVKTLEDNKLDILSGIYYRRREPYDPVFYKETHVSPAGQISVTKWEGELPTELFEIGSCGFGCVLMRTQVLFDCMARFRDMFSPIGKSGEDIAFCVRAAECGYKIWADPSISLGHASHTIVTKQFYEAYKGVKNNGTD